MSAAGAAIGHLAWLVASHVLLPAAAIGLVCLFIGAVVARLRHQ